MAFDQFVEIAAALLPVDLFLLVIDLVAHGANAGVIERDALAGMRHDAFGAERHLIILGGVGTVAHS